MTKNSGSKPRTGAQGQSQACNEGKGGYNKPAKPFGMKQGSSNHPGHASPQFGVSGQRLAGGKGKGPSGYPPGYTSR